VNDRKASMVALQPERSFPQSLSNSFAGMAELTMGTLDACKPAADRASGVGTHRVLSTRIRFLRTTGPVPPSDSVIIHNFQLEEP
jgi:hypothetical protein